MGLPAIFPAVLVDPSRPTSITPYGLFSVGPVLPLTRPVSVEWENRVCVAVHSTVSECISGVEAADKDLSGGQTWQHAEPFVLYSATDCIPDPIDDSDARVRDRIAAGEQFGTERAFKDNVLQSTPTVVGSALDARAAVARMEQTLGEHYGVPGVIHVSRELFSLARLRTTVAAGQLRTDLGTLVVAGAGYNIHNVVWGTGPIRVYRSDMEVVEAFDQVNNNDYFLVERSYVVAADLCDDVFAVTGVTTPA